MKAKACKVCQHPLLEEPLIRLHDMPSVAQNFPREEELDSDGGVSFDVMECSGCGLIQLTSEPVAYHRDVIRAAAGSPEMMGFRREQFLGFLTKFVLMGKRLVEIGCGRGEYLSLMGDAGARVAGLEHCAESVAVCRSLHLEVEQGYVESEDYRISGAPFDGFFILNFLEHIPGINSFLRGIANNLLPGGIGLVEVPNFELMLREGHVSEFMTDHLYYFTRETLATTLRVNGFEILSCGEIWHDYIISAVVRRREPISGSVFQEPVKDLRRAFDDFLAAYPAKSVVIWGAGHQALAAISLYRLGDRISYVVDSAPFKQGRFTPASHLPIRSPGFLKSDPDVRAVIVMGGGYSEEIAAAVARDFHLPVAILLPGKLEVRS